MSFLVSLSSNFSTICLDVFSKFANKFRQKSLIFQEKRISKEVYSKPLVGIDSSDVF